MLATERGYTDIVRVIHDEEKRRASLRSPSEDARKHLEGFRMTLDRCDPNVRGAWETTILHAIAASRGRLTAGDRLAYASLVLDAGARLDVRDDLLRSTPLGWACRWGRIELVRLLLTRGADPVEADAELWARPREWAEKMHRDDVMAALRSHGAGPG